MKGTRDILAADISGEWAIGKHTGRRTSPTHDEIAQLAFSLYKARGRQGGRRALPRRKNSKRRTQMTETNVSLDNTSHPGRPGPADLVPSRYALRVGEIDVLVVSDGVITLPSAMLAHNFCGSWLRPASPWWPLTCRSRPSPMWRSPATSFVAYRPSESTDRCWVRAELGTASGRGRKAGPGR